MSESVVVPPPSLPQFEAGTLAASQEAMVHALCGAPFGDMEYDVGKSIRWTQWFVDDVFITDVNLGTPRYWIVNWTGTYPQAFHHVTGINYFVVPQAFRKEQFAGAMREPGILLEPEDWVIFVDAHEGLSIDTRNPQPADVDITLFRSYLYREIARANAAGKDRLVLPFYAFLRHDDIITAQYPSDAYADGTTGFTTAAGTMATPYYLPHQGLTRMMKVKVLQDPSFNWASIDQPSAPDTGMNIAIISYGYAHWHLQDIVPPATMAPPLTEANDDGWRMRNLLSQVRPIPTLPYGSPYQSPITDPLGLPGPWAPADQNTPDPIIPSGPYLNPLVGTATLPDPGPLPNGATLVFKIRPTRSSAAPNVIVGQFEEPNQNSWTLQWYEPGIQAFYISISATGSIGATQQRLISSPNNITNKDAVMAVSTLNSGGRNFLSLHQQLPDGTWGQLGSVDAGTALVPFDATSVLRIGARTVNASPFNGRIYWVECRTGLDPAGGIVLWRFDAADPAADPDAIWTLTNVNALVFNTNDPQSQPIPPNPALAGLLVGLYDNYFRINMRDGVWYTGDENGTGLGNIPLAWDEENEMWVPRDMSPQEWHETEEWVATPP